MSGSSIISERDYTYSDQSSSIEEIEISNRHEADSSYELKNHNNPEKLQKQGNIKNFDTLSVSIQDVCFYNLKLNFFSAFK